MKFVLAYFDATEDLHLTPASLDAADRLKPGQEKKWLNPWDNDSARRRGWLVIPAKVLFEDGSTFTDAVHVPDCYAVLWYDKKHPRLTELPMEVMKRLSATTTP